MRKATCTEPPSGAAGPVVFKTLDAEPSSRSNRMARRPFYIPLSEGRTAPILRATCFLIRRATCTARRLVAAAPSVREVDVEQCSGAIQPELRLFCTALPEALTALALRQGWLGIQQGIFSARPSRAPKALEQYLRCAQTGNWSLSTASLAATMARILKPSYFATRTGRYTVRPEAEAIFTAPIPLA